MKIKRFTLLILLVCVFFSGQAQKKLKVADEDKPLNAKQVKALIDSLIDALTNWYIYPDKAALIVNALKTDHKNGNYNSAKNPYELIALINKDIYQAHKDKHMRVRFEPEFNEETGTQPTEEQIKEGLELSLIDARNDNFSVVKAEMLPHKIGYVRWDLFYDIALMKESKPTFDAAFQLIKNCQALIVDMRYNGGGQPEMVHFTQSYFFNQKTHMNDIIDRKNDTVLKAWADPTKTDIKINVPVYILSSRRTFSGGEDFVFGLQKAKRATVIGDTTGGGAHPTDMYYLGQGFLVSIPLMRSSNVFAKTDWEGTGIYPDVPINSEKALAKAQTLILTEMLPKITDEFEKKRFLCDINSLRAKSMQKDSLKLPEDLLQKYSGTYFPDAVHTEAIPITLVLNCSILTRQAKGLPDVRLIPIAQNKFMYDDDTGKILEFISDKEGAITGVDLHWWTEYHFTKKK